VLEPTKDTFSVRATDLRAYQIYEVSPLGLASLPAQYLLP
jgi:hypothetical protein